MATQGPHAILLAYPLQGHLIPAVNLAIKLASRGFTITFVNTISVHHQASKSNFSSNNGSCDGGGDMFAATWDSGLDIRYATVSDGLPHDRSLNQDQFMMSLVMSILELSGPNSTSKVSSRREGCLSAYKGYLCHILKRCGTLTHPPHA